MFYSKNPVFSEKKEESLANGHGERRFMKTIMMHAAV